MAEHSALLAPFREDLQRDPEAAAGRWLTEVHPRVYRLPAFDPEWCLGFSQAVDARRAELARAGARLEPPNSLHEAGVGLDLLGWEHAFDALLARWIYPLAARAFGDLGGATLDGVRGFLADYGEGADEDLAFHVDDSEVTLNLCLEGDFHGSELYFRGLRCDLHRQTPCGRDEAFEYEHEPGVAVLHAGPHRHGVESILGGRRRNLILWLRSARERAKREPGACPAWCGARAQRRS